MQIQALPLAAWNTLMRFRMLCAARRSTTRPDWIFPQSQEPPLSSWRDPRSAISNHLFAA